MFHKWGKNEGQKKNMIMKQTHELEERMLAEGREGERAWR
jgi:hypothetical protein